MPILSPITKKLLDQYKLYHDQLAAKKSTNVIVVNEAIGTAAFLYERARTVIDYKEEHLLKKDAIKRILQRRLKRDADPKKVARLMLRELIRSRYLANSTVPVEEIARVAEIFRKYQVLAAQQSIIKSWLIAVAACEIDDQISLYIREDALVEAMNAKIADKIAVPAMDDETRQVQLFIAIHRALVKSDTDLVRYGLLRSYSPGWRSLTAEQVAAPGVAERVVELQQKIESQLVHPTRNRLLNVVRKYAAPFLILREVIEQDPKKSEQLLQYMPHEKMQSHGFDKPPQYSFDDYFEKVVTRKYAELQTRVRRRAFRAVLYLFLTKVVLAVVLEIPYDLAVHGVINGRVLGINLLFHPLFVFVLAFLVRPPSARNTEGLIQGIKEIVFADAKQKMYTPTRVTASRRSVLSGAVFTIFYLLLFVVTYGAIIAVLRKLQFNLMSTAIFVILFSTVSFFAVSLRYLMKEYVVAKVRENFFTFLFDVFTLPIILAGRWISVNFSRINVFVFLLDVIIEAPFQTLIIAFEKWIGFIREKRDEIV